MKRRAFIAGLGWVAAWPVLARAQQQPTPMIGFLHSGSSQAFSHLIAAVHQGLAEAGYVEGQNVLTQYRWADGRNDRLSELAADLLKRRPAVIVAMGSPNPALAAKAATATIPIVFVTGTDPVESGLLTSVSRPDSNLTGVYMFATLLNAKRQEQLHELVPTARSVAMFVNPTRASTRTELEEIRVAAVKIGQSVRIFSVSTDRELEDAFSKIVEERIGGLIVHGDPFFTARRDQLVLLTTRHAIPSIFAWREFAASGGLMSFGTSFTTAYRQAGSYVGKILKGAKPIDLPVLQPTTFELVINLRAAKALNLTIPPTLLARADEVIE